jgi:hypothetical protein
MGSGAAIRGAEAIAYNVPGILKPLMQHQGVLPARIRACVASFRRNATRADKMWVEVLRGNERSN